MASIKQIFGKINPHLYAEKGDELLAKYGSIDKIPADEVKAINLGEHRIVYDSSSETLEPLYFWVLDVLEARGLGPEKIIDNFASSPGSGHFAELGQRASIMQQQGSKILGDVNTVLRSVLNIIYDLKEFRIRLEHYDALKIKDKDKVQSATLSLKQVWIDKVDIAKGNSSVKAMAFQGGFQTLLHAFLAAKDEKDVENMDLNDVVKRILKPRIQEFNFWLVQSENELRKRYELEKTYLRSQVNSLKLYARWAKPYLKAAQQLEMKDMDKEASLVKSFNTIILELTLLGKSKLNVRDLVLGGKLPKDFMTLKLTRDYYSCVLVEFRFRGIPQRAGGQQSHYVFGGKAEIVFSAYAFNQDELDLFKQEMQKSDLEDVLKLVSGTTDSLGQLQEEINSFLEEKSKDAKKKEARGSEEINPFFAAFGYYNVSSDERESMRDLPLKDKMRKIFGFGKKPEEKKEKKDIKNIRRDDWIEGTHLRKLAADAAKETTFDIFDIYKKQHGMPSYT
ncbi:MAG: hypothetical protein AABX93_02895 [Nanoarchaeota archaeon]